jgi:uncharacterized protein (DUF2147 family)
MNKYWAFIFLFTLTCVFSHAQSQIVGVWYNTVKTGKVEISKVNNQYFGKIIWLKEPLSEKTGKQKVDEYNPDKNLTKNPIIGLEVLKGFEFDGNNVYKNGTIYDPENGKTYKCKITQVDENNLDLRGYIGVPALGRTEKWTRTAK